MEHERQTGRRRILHQSLFKQSYSTSFEIIKTFIYFMVIAILMQKRENLVLNPIFVVMLDELW